jgi:gluconate 2-dehydrogenase alpha chain
MADAARRLGWHPFPGPSAIRSEPYNGLNACAYHGFCMWGAVTWTPRGRARAVEITVDREGRANGVRYVKNGSMRFQPAKAVLLAGYTYENTRLLLLSTSAAYPNGLSNNHGQVGRHYQAHVRAGANGVIPGRRLNRFSGTANQWTAVDDWDSDFFDHTGLGFTGGGTMSATMEAKPIGAASTTPPSLPRWGSAWKAWLKQNAISVASAATQINVAPYEDIFLDLDPVTKDPDGWCFSHEVPNLGVLGASNFPTSGGGDPTETVMALAWRSAEHLAEEWEAIAG